MMTEQYIDQIHKEPDVCILYGEELCMISEHKGYIMTNAVRLFGQSSDDVGIAGRSKKPDICIMTNIQHGGGADFYEIWGDIQPATPELIEQYGLDINKIREDVTDFFTEVAEENSTTLKDYMEQHGISDYFVNQTSPIPSL